jgi:hypothetical protein
MSECSPMIPLLFGKQEVGIWQVKKHFPRYGVPIWSLWPNIRSLSSIVAADFVDFYTHWTYMLIFRRIFLSNYWWQKSDVWSQASYRYPILWEVFFDLSDSYFLFAEERGYHRWALAHSSSCFFIHWQPKTKLQSYYRDYLNLSHFTRHSVW